MVPLSSPPSVSSPPLLHQNTIFKIDLPLTVYVKTTTLCGVFWSSEFSWKHEESLGSSFPAAAPFEAGCGDLVIAGDDTIPRRISTIPASAPLHLFYNIKSAFQDITRK